MTVREVPAPLKVRYALIAVPILMASLDLVENGCITRDIHARLGHGRSQ
jgi:hypothetical protein